MREKSLHAVCRWTFNPGKGGFTPGDIRPEWAGLDAAAVSEAFRIFDEMYRRAS